MKIFLDHSIKRRKEFWNVRNGKRIRASRQAPVESIPSNWLSLVMSSLFRFIIFPFLAYVLGAGTHVFPLHSSLQSCYLPSLFPLFPLSCMDNFLTNFLSSIGSGITFLSFAIFSLSSYMLEFFIIFPLSCKQHLSLLSFPFSFFILHSYTLGNWFYKIGNYF